MEAVRTAQDVTASDLAWKIDYDIQRCTLCGSCIAACTFGAIEAGVLRLERRDSQAPFPGLASGQASGKAAGQAGQAGQISQAGKAAEPASSHGARPCIRQRGDLAHACSGCGMCEKICPNGAIRPVRNPDARTALLGRLAGPAKRGGRTSLNAQRSLDAIVVGRISQMTDPALDAERHTFDLRAPLGRVLKADRLPLKVEGESLILDGPTPPVRWIYPLLFSDMSIGALSPRAWEAVVLAVAYLNEQCRLPVRMSSGEGGMPQRLLESEKLKYMILQIASGHFGWNRILRTMPRMKADPCAVLIKIGQGAKPGDGGLLPAAKVGPHIQAIRGVPKATLHSPANHQGLYSIEESVQKMHLSLNAAFGFRVPVAIKCAASATSVAVYNNLLRDPYHICGGFFLDGIQGGTGAANEVSLDHTGHPIVSKLRDCYLAAVRQGAQGQIPLWCGGGIGMTGTAAPDAFKLVCLGANGVFVGKMLLQLLGCVGNERGRCNRCNTGLCPTGICTQDPRLVKRLDVDRGAQRIVDYVLAFDSEMRKLMAPVGNSSLPVGRSDALVATDRAVADKLGIQYAC